MGHELILVSLFGWIVLLSTFCVHGLLLGVHNFEIFPDDGSTAIYNLAKQLKPQVVRYPLGWFLVEPDMKGVTYDWIWEELETEFNGFTSIGAKIILEMANPPCWASSMPNKNCNNDNNYDYLRYPPLNYNDYADAAELLINRFSNQIYAFEVWNEPNFVNNWGHNIRNQNNDDWDDFSTLNVATEYANLVKIVYARIKSINPNIYVLAGSLAGADTFFVESMYSVPGFANSFDAMAMHPYTAPIPNSNDPRYGQRYGIYECYYDYPFWCFVEGLCQIKINQFDFFLFVCFCLRHFAHFSNGSRKIALIFFFCVWLKI